MDRILNNPIFPGNQVSQLRARIDTKDNQIATLTAQVEDMREIITKLVKQLSPEPFGTMSGMADQKKRFEWYDKTQEVRLCAEAILASLEPAQGGGE